MIFEKHTNWLTAPEYQSLKPVNVFAREGTDLPDIENGPQNVHIYARRTFRVGTSIHSASLLISADDYYKLWINGKFVAQGPAPGYPDAYYVNRIDISEYLQAGENVIALDVYYQGLVNRVWVSGDRRIGFICELRVDDKVIVRSDERFRCLISKSYKITGTSGYKTRYLENFDSREEPFGWKDTGFDDFMWSSCSIKSDVDYEFKLQDTPVLSTEIIKPSIITEEENRKVYEFPSEIAANFLITASGTSGKKLTVRCGEELNDDGTVRWQTRANCVNEDTFIMNGKTVQLETYDYLAFRYAEIITDDGVTVDSFAARAQHYPADTQKCLLDTDDRMLSDVFELCKNTMVYAVQEGFLDCPGREKGQYSGDLAVTSLSHLYITGDDRLLRKALTDWMRSSFIAPALMAVFPSALNQEIADYSFLFPMTAIRYYEHTGDRDFLRECTVAAGRILETYRKYKRADGLLETVTEAWNLVDWPKNLRDDYDFAVDRPIKEGCHNVINAMYIGAVAGYEKMRELLDEKHDHETEELSAAFDKVFLDPETGLYVDAEGSRHSSLHSNIFPLFFGFADKKNTQKIAAWLVSRGMSCGVYMAFFYLKALARAGRYDAVYSLLVSDSEHSWGNMLKEGATTLFEAWGKDQKWNTSLCHPWASCPISVLIEDILGVTPAVVNGEKWTHHLPGSIRNLRMTVPVAGKTCIVSRDDDLTTLTIK